MSFQRSALALALCSLIAACAAPAHERVVVRETVQVRSMPAPITEVITVAPGPGYQWVPGHWAWRGRDWVWQNGYWYAGMVRPMPALIVEQRPPMPTPHHFWVQGHWVWGHHDWVWVGGRWMR